MPSLEDSRIELAFSRFRASRRPTLPPYLLIVDCETRRFTIERPSTADCFDLWCREVEHAVAAGRHIICVPIQDKSTADIEGLGTSLGYALWPSRTILSPPAAQEMGKPIQMSVNGGVARPRDEEQKKRLLARVGAV